MFPDLQKETPYIRLQISGIEKEAPSLPAFITFFADFNTVYSQLRLALDERYGANLLRRPIGPSPLELQPADQLYIDRCHLGSPIHVEFVLALAGGAATATFVFLQTLEKAYNLRANKRKTEAETSKLIAETQKLQLENLETIRRLALQPGQSEEAIARHLAAHISNRPIKKALRRLQDSPIQLSSARADVTFPGEHAQKENQ